MTRKFHPAAGLFPMMGEEELRELAADILDNGLYEPIVLIGEKVLDGRNRLLACEIAQIEPVFREFEGDNPYAYVVSRNIHRRNLTASQRAAIAAEAREPLMAEGRRRMSVEGKKGAKAQWGHGVSSKEQTPSEQGKSEGKTKPLRSREIVGEMFGVAHAQVGRAWKVKQQRPDLFEKIKGGEVTVGTAYKEVRDEPPVGGEIDASHPRMARIDTPLSFGADKWGEVMPPVRQYLSLWRRKGMRFSHINNAEARKRLKMIDALIVDLQTARIDIEQRAQKAKPFTINGGPDA